MIPNARPIRVLIADGDPLVCRALARLLQDAVDVEVVATAVDEQAALALAVQLQPEVGLVDVRTASLDGMALTRSLHQQVPATRVIVLGVYATFRHQALAAGACRFLLKDCGRDELVAAIHLAARGQCHGQCQANGDAQPGC